MTSRTVAVMTLALVFGTATAVLVWQIPKRESPTVERVEVVVARADIPMRTRILPGMLTTRLIPREIVPPSAITSRQQAIHQLTLVPLAEGELLLPTKLTSAGHGPIDPLIPDGYRAFSIRVVDTAAILEGLLLPGSKVDVVLTITRSTPEVNDQPLAKLLLQNVEILAVGQQYDQPAGDNKFDAKSLRSVTLLVDPQQSVDLQLAQSVGSLHLVLRNGTETQVSVATQRNLFDLLDVESKQGPVRPVNPPVDPTVVKPLPRGHYVGVKGIYTGSDYRNHKIFVPDVQELNAK